eukprot:scaffold19212_cov141-Isochrysis_galbana.AAC.1
MQCSTLSISFELDKAKGTISGVAYSGPSLPLQRDAMCNTMTRLYVEDGSTWWSQHGLREENTAATAPRLLASTLRFPWRRSRARLLAGMMRSSFTCGSI